MKGRVIRQALLTLLALVIVTAAAGSQTVYGYYNRGTVQLSLGGSSATLNVGETTTISATMSPASYSGIIGCGQAICPQQCNGKCGDEVTGACACAGPDRKTENARASVSVADPFVASASYSNGTITIKGKKAGSTTVTVVGTLWQHSESSPETISVTVENPNSGGGDSEGGGTSGGGGGSGGGNPGTENPPAASPVTNQPSPITNNPPAVVPSPVPVATPYVPVPDATSPKVSSAPQPEYSASSGQDSSQQNASGPSPAPAVNSGTTPYVPQYSQNPAPLASAAAGNSGVPDKAQPTPYRPEYVQNVPQPSPVSAIPLPSADMSAAFPGRTGSGSGGSGTTGGGGSSAGGGTVSSSGGSGTAAASGGGAGASGNGISSGTLGSLTGSAGAGGKPYVSAAKPYVAVIAPYVPLVAAQGTNISEKEQQEVIAKMQALAPVTPKTLAGEGGEQLQPEALSSEPSASPGADTPETKEMQTMRGAMKMITLTDTGILTGKAAMEEAKEKKERLTFQKLNDSGNVLYSWNFDGDTLGTPEDISFQIDFPEQAPVLKKAASSLVKPFYISFVHDGDLPGPAEIYVNTGSRFSESDNLTLYLLDTQKGRLVPAATNLSVSAGYVSFTISHNSDYVLAVGAPSYSSGGRIIVVAVAVLLVIAAGASALILSGVRRRRQFRDAA
ncbi:hypothetical protein D3C81_556600 [compost metagenome]